MACSAAHRGDAGRAGGQRPDAFAYSFVGAVVAVFASWLAIAAYGASPIFLYVGVVLALLSPIAVGYTFYRELRD